MTRRDLAGATVVITGGAGGLGAAMAAAFGATRAQVGLLDIDGRGAEQQAGELEAAGLAAMGVACDVTDPESCRAAFDQVRGRFGPIDVLVNNAGLTHRSAFSATDLAVFRRVMEVNYFGSLNCTKAALGDLLARRGLIITISSVAGIAPLLGRTGYAASKHALHGLFGSLRTELAADGVDVLMVCPGFTATNFRFRALGADGIVTDHPQSRVGRLADPTAVAGSVVKAARRGRRLLVLSAAGRATYWLSKLAPCLYERIMTRSLHEELER